MNLSDLFKLTRVYREDPMLQSILERYQEWPLPNWTPEQASLDIGYLMGVIERLDRERQTLQ
jgi:hypothetical protein